MKRRTFIKSMIISSSTFALGSHDLLASSANSDSIKLLMVYNNAGRDDKLIKKWGLSVWIEHKDKAVLFDTGGIPGVLFQNMTSVGVDLNKLDSIVISHNHRDHVRGLPIVLEKTNHRLKVYLPDYEAAATQSLYPKTTFIGVANPMQITPYLFSTGQMLGDTPRGSIYEQSIIIEKGKSMFILTGCAHPGIVEIVKKSKQLHPNKSINLVGGGFHLMRHTQGQVEEISTDLKKLGVENLAPSHCTGKLATSIFKQKWQDNFVDFGIGNEVII